MDGSRVNLRRYYIVICMKVTCRARNVVHFAAQAQGFMKVTRSCRYSIGISVWRVVFWGVGCGRAIRVCVSGCGIETLFS